MNNRRDDTTTATTRKSLGSAPFAITARIALQLGRESISNSIVAIIELVKNAYDADAENVYIMFRNITSGNGEFSELIIEDDGSGMTLEQLDNRWLIIGTDTKQVDSKSKTKQRVLTGEKGLGRLGLDRICARTQMQTFVADSDEGLELDIDWTKYESRKNSRLESVLHERYEIHKPQHRDAVWGRNVPFEKGTRLVLTGLKDAWTAEDLERLRSELALLVSPFAGINDFSIHLYTDNLISPEGRIISDSLLNAAEWKVVSKLEVVDGEYYFDFDMTSPLREAKFHDPPIPWTKVFPELHNRQPRCGPLHCELYYIPREGVPEKSFKRAQVTRFLDSNQGIRIYRDNFRVMPYGKPSGEGDWLNLGLRRTRSPEQASGRLGAWRIGYNQVVGAVFIGREHNAALLDQTNREGIVEGDAYNDLRRFALKTVEMLERQHQEFVHSQGPKDRPRPNEQLVEARVAAEETSKASREAIERMRDIVQSTAQLLSEPSTDPSVVEKASQTADELVQVFAHLDRSVKDQQGRQEQFVQVIERVEDERQEEFQRQKDTLGNLASLGILATTFGHETEAASNVMLANSVALKAQVEGIPWVPPQQQEEIRENLEHIVYGANRISTFAGFTLRNVARDKRFRTKVFLDKVIHRVFSSFKQALVDERRITLAFDFPDPDQVPPITAFSIDWESIIVNFITNAVWALENTPAERRKIRVRLTASDDRLILAFADSGCGVAAGTLGNIFEPTFTTKRNLRGDLIGTGMGLAIVQNLLHSYGGSIRVESPCDLGGAEFIVEVPLRTSEQETD